MKEKQPGLQNRYNVTPIDGPADPNAEYFVLRLDKKQSNGAHLVACRAAINEYANTIKKSNPELANDIKTKWPVNILYSGQEVAEITKAAVESTTKLLNQYWVNYLNTYKQQRESELRNTQLANQGIAARIHSPGLLQELLNYYPKTDPNTKTATDEAEKPNSEFAGISISYPNAGYYTNSRKQAIEQQKSGRVLNGSDATNA